MIRRFGLLVLLLAFAALPLRGMAAVAMWHCMQDQHDAIFASADQHAQYHTHSSLDAHADSHAAHDPASPEVALAEPADDTSATGSPHCIAGAGGAAAPSTWICASFPPVGTNRIPFIEQKFVAVVPAQLDRPPLVQSL